MSPWRDGKTSEKATRLATRSLLGARTWAAHALASRLHDVRTMTTIAPEWLALARGGEGGTYLMADGSTNRPVVTCVDDQLSRKHMMCSGVPGYSTPQRVARAFLTPFSR